MVFLFGYLAIVTQGVKLPNGGAGVVCDAVYAGEMAVTRYLKGILRDPPFSKIALSDTI